MLQVCGLDVDQLHSAHCVHIVTGTGPQRGPTMQEVLWIMTPTVWKSLCSLWHFRCPKWHCLDLRSSGMRRQSWCFEGTHHLPLQPVYYWQWGMYVPVYWKFFLDTSVSKMNAISAFKRRVLLQPSDLSRRLYICWKCRKLWIQWHGTNIQKTWIYTNTHFYKGNVIPCYCGSK
jgi:hypothetical protein